MSLTNQEQLVLYAFDNKKHDYIYNLLKTQGKHSIFKVCDKIAFKLLIDTERSQIPVEEVDGVNIPVVLANKDKKEYLKEVNNKYYYLDSGGFSSSKQNSITKADKKTKICNLYQTGSTINIPLVKKSHKLNSLPAKYKKLFRKQFGLKRINFINKNLINFYFIPILTMVSEKQIIINNKIITKLLKMGYLTIKQENDNYFLTSNTGNVKIKLRDNWENLKNLYTNIYVGKNFGNSNITKDNLRDYENSKKLQSLEDLLKMF